MKEKRLVFFLFRTSRFSIPIGLLPLLIRVLSIRLLMFVSMTFPAASAALFFIMSHNDNFLFFSSISRIDLNHKNSPTKIKWLRFSITQNASLICKIKKYHFAFCLAKYRVLLFKFINKIKKSDFLLHLFLISV